MNDNAMKYDGKKVRLDLLPVQPIIEIGKVLTYGAKKYSERNWEKGLAWSRCYAASLRHLLAWQSGETNDPETGLSHLAHAACEILFLLEFSRTHPELDDRPLPKTLLDVVRATLPNTDTTGDGCPNKSDYTEAFRRAGYKQPDKFFCEGIDDPFIISCEACWNRPAEKLESEKLKAQLDPLEAIKSVGTPSPDLRADVNPWIDAVYQFNDACNTLVERDLASRDWYASLETQLKLIHEESAELDEAYYAWLDDRTDDVISILDAICDSIYVLIGLALKMGFNLDGAFHEVHRSNMSKLGKDGKPIKRADGKILKGPNFTPPKLDAYI